MPERKVPLENDCYYHVVTKSLQNVKLFKQYEDYFRFIDSLDYYNHEDPPIKYSLFLESDLKTQDLVRYQLKEQKRRFDLIAYSLLPNHLHLLLKQNLNKGISKAMQQVKNSYAHFFNIKYKREGPLFRGRFKAVLIETEEQFLHVSRYIHINIYSSGIAKTIPKLLKYEFSSLPEYISKVKQEICQKKDVFESFNSKDRYKSFVLDRADYQKSLEVIKKSLKL